MQFFRGLFLIAFAAQGAAAFQMPSVPTARDATRASPAPVMVGSLESWESHLLPETIGRKKAERGTPMPWKLSKGHKTRTRTVDLDDFGPEPTRVTSVRIQALAWLREMTK